MNTQLKLIWIILFCFSIMANANEKQSSITMTPLKNSPFYTVDVTIGDFGTTKMLVDTGASDTVLADWFVEKNKIPLEEMKGQGVDSGANKFELKKAKVDAITINNEKYVLKSIFVVPSPTSLKEAKIGGIFSPQTAFEGKDFILDFPNKKIVLGSISSDKKVTEKKLI